MSRGDGSRRESFEPKCRVLSVDRRLAKELSLFLRIILAKGVFVDGEIFGECAMLGFWLGWLSVPVHGAGRMRTIISFRTGWLKWLKWLKWLTLSRRIWEQWRAGSKSIGWNIQFLQRFERACSRFVDADASWYIRFWPEGWFVRWSWWYDYCSFQSR